MEEWSTHGRDWSTRDSCSGCSSVRHWPGLNTCWLAVETNHIIYQDLQLKWKFLKMLVEKKLKYQQYTVDVIVWCHCFQDLLIIPFFPQDFLFDWASALASDTVLCGDVLLITAAFHMIIPPPFCRIILEVFWCIRAAMPESEEWMNESIFTSVIHNWNYASCSMVESVDDDIIVQKLCCGGLCVSDLLLRSWPLCDRKELLRCYSIRSRYWHPRGVIVSWPLEPTQFGAQWWMINDLPTFFGRNFSCKFTHLIRETNWYKIDLEGLSTST